MEEFRCGRVRVALAPHEPAGKRAVIVGKILGEALQEHVFGGLAQPEFGDRQPPVAPGLARERDLPMPLDGVDKAIPVIVHTMETAADPAVRLTVPIKVDAHSAHNWDEAH